MTNTKQVIKHFEDFSIFMGFWIFQHTKKQDKKSKIKNNKRTKKQKSADTRSRAWYDAWVYYIKHRKYWCMDIRYNHAWVPLFTHTSRAFEVISLWDWVQELGLSNLLEKLSKHVVKAPIIFITSIIQGSPSWLLDCSPPLDLLWFLGPRDLGLLALFNALNLWQLSWVCPWSSQ